MIKVMKRFVSVAILAVACTSLRAGAQSDEQPPEEANRAVKAVDASVHPEVDTLAQEPAPAEASAKLPTTLNSAKRPPVSVVWPAHVDTSIISAEDKTGTHILEISSFRPGTQSAPLGVWKPTLAHGAKDDSKNGDAAQIPLRQWNVPTALPLHGRTAQVLSPQTTVPPLATSGAVSGFSSPFGHTVLGLPATIVSLRQSDFREHKYQPTAKQSLQHARKIASRAKTKSPSDSLTSTQH